MVINWKNVGVALTSLFFGMFLCWAITPGAPVPKDGYYVQNGVTVLTHEGEIYYEFEHAWYDDTGERVPFANPFFLDGCDLDNALAGHQLKERLVNTLVIR